MNWKIPDHADARFGAVRKHDIHTGVDIYCDPGTPVPALESGTVVQKGQFTGPEVDSPWWNSTDYVAIKGDSGTIVYGEIQSDLAVGGRINKGDVVGRVLTVLKKDKGRPTTMLHLELYNDLFKEPVVWHTGLYRPESLENPEKLLPMKRLDFEAQEIDQALAYMKTRSYQLLISDYKIVKVQVHPWGVECWYTKNNQMFPAYYILKQMRGQGILAEQARKHKQMIITMQDCKIVPYLQRFEISNVCQHSVCDTEEYKAIELVYRDRRAKRSGQLYMQHIDEGLRILRHLGAGTDTEQAFCLHPLFQADEDLAQTMQNIDLSRFSSRAVALAMEYRHFANAYLAKRQITSLDDIQMSPLEQVRQMLIADKIQNFKDIQLYNYNHQNFAGLTRYFVNWHDKLGIGINSHPALYEFAAIEKAFAVL